MTRWMWLAAALAVASVVCAHGPGRAGRTVVPQGEDADRAAIQKTAQEFAKAFNAGDAGAIAAMWTENAECREAQGQSIVGRAAIEEAYAAFFKAHPGVKAEVLVQSIRFPAKDLAVEQGLLRQTASPLDLPTTTAYQVIHVREGGRWRMALSTENGTPQDRLEDLEWLLGEWSAQGPQGTAKLVFQRDPKQPVITATMTRTPTGKAPIQGVLRICVDPQSGQIRSWGFEEDGGHSQALWHCDGKSWMVDSRGVLGDGTPMAERFILIRAGADVITWRTIDRQVGDAILSDTAPLRLTRGAASK